MSSPSSSPQVTNSRVIQSFRNVLVFLSQLSVFVSIGGFVVVQRFIASYSSYFVYDVVPIQYLAAGASLFIYVPIYFVAKLVQEFGTTVLTILLILLVVALYVCWQLWKTRHSGKNVQQRSRTALERVGDLILLISPFQKQMRIAYIVYLVLFAIGAGFAYGQAGYATFPRWLGGGIPAPITVIFKSDVDTTGFPFAVNNSQTAKVLLLVELGKGILVWDEQSKMTVNIPYDILSGIVGSPPPTKTTNSTGQQIQVTPQPTIQPTATP